MSRNTGSSEGLKSELLRAALSDALSGKPARLEALLATHSSLPSPRPNLKLAAAFGAEVAALPGTIAPLLLRLGADDAAPDTPRAFLPVVAAHGWAGRIRAQRELEPAWAALAELAGDERAPVRIGTLDALIGLSVRPGGPDQLVGRASTWLQLDDRELRFGAAALVLEVFGDKAVLATPCDHDALLEYIATVIELVAQAPRAAERSDGRRRVLMSLPRTLAAVATAVRDGDRGTSWLQSQCASAAHPDIRNALSQAIDQLRNKAHGHSAATIEVLRQALEASAKPVRDAARVRIKPGSGRGKRSRRTR